MSFMQQLESSDSYLQSAVPQGHIVTFKSMSNGKIVERAKLSDGSFVTVAGQGTSSGDTYTKDQIDQQLNTITTTLSNKAQANHTHDFGAYAQVTKFQVLANNVQIPAGASDSYTGLTYTNAVPANMTHRFRLRTDQVYTDNDVVIDWGDGNTSTLASGQYSAVDDRDWQQYGQLIYTFEHTYTAPGRYIVTVNGKNYWGMQTFSTSVSSLLSRIFDKDLPFAPWLVNFASLCMGSPRLLRVNIPTGLDLFTNVHNASSIFVNCTNLLSATNFNTKFQFSRYVSGMFSGCTSLATCDFRLPANIVMPSGYEGVFKGCSALAVDINNLLPLKGFDGSYIQLTDTFKGCASLTGTVPASILWEDMSVRWIPSNVFTGCSQTVRAQVPVSWGGTMADTQIPYPITRSQATPIIQSKVDAVLQDLNVQTAGTQTGYGNVLGGYGVLVSAYNADTRTFTVVDSNSSNPVQWDKLTAGVKLRVNDSGQYSDAQTQDILYLQSTIQVANKTAKTLQVAPWAYALEDSDSNLVYRDVSLDLASNAQARTAVIRVADLDRKDSAFSSGDKNFVTGMRSFADNSWNTVYGDLSGAQGSLNTVTGTLSFARGSANTVHGDDTIVDGTGNTVQKSASMVQIIGDNNVVGGQGTVVLGNGHNDMTGICMLGIGNGNSGSGSRSVSIGSDNVNNGENSVVIGHSSTTRAKSATLIGAWGQLQTQTEHVQGTISNRQAVAFGGGQHGGTGVGLIYRPLKGTINPAWDPASDSAQKFLYQQGYQTRYRGHLLPWGTKIDTQAATITLDHDLQARWQLTFSGSCTLALSNWKDGDVGELVVDTSKQNITFPSAWITTGFDIVTSPGVYVVQIAMVGTSVHYRVKWPVSASGGLSYSIVSSVPSDVSSYADGHLFVVE